MRKVYGFTLLEILIAITILSIIAILMSRGLQIVMVSKERIDVANKTLEETQLAFSLISQDLQQLVNRPVLDNAGQTEKAFVAQAIQITFTRGGYVNPEGIEKRSTLQRVRYYLNQEKLERVSWPVLDRISSTTESHRVLFKKVRSVEWKFLANDHKLYSEWPQADQNIPNGIEINLSLDEGKTIKQLFMLNITEPPNNVKQNNTPAGM